MSHPTFFVKSYGCQMNMYDSKKIVSILENKGLRQNKDIETEVLKKFNQQLSNHKNLETVLLPIRDGISLSIKF